MEPKDQQHEEPKKAKKKTRKPRKKKIDPVYGSLVHVLESLIPAMKGATGATIHALEFGSGDYSTPVLAASCAGISIERKLDWAERLSAAVSDYPDWAIVDPGYVDMKAFDLVVVDGETEERVPAARSAFKARVPVVVLHDTEKVTWYGYDQLGKPGVYRLFEFRMDEAPHKQTRIYALGEMQAVVDSIHPKNHTRIRG